MDAAETARYLACYLKVAGRSDTLLSDAMALVHRVPRGLPRAATNLAVQSLVRLRRRDRLFANGCSSIISLWCSSNAAGDLLLAVVVEDLLVSGPPGVVAGCMAFRIVIAEVVDRQRGPSF
ncbi:MAG: hypothetical protein ACLQCU_05050 [Acidimicrobiales bacterium]|jgi:hypothetical protein